MSNEITNEEMLDLFHGFEAEVEDIKVDEKFYTRDLILHQGLLASVTVAVCKICGAIVIDKEVHEDFHSRI